MFEKVHTISGKSLTLFDREPVQNYSQSFDVRIVLQFVEIVLVRVNHLTKISFRVLRTTLGYSFGIKSSLEPF